MAARWTHVTIPVADLDRSIAWYAKRCGLVVVRDRRPTGGGTVWLATKPVAEGEHPAFVLVLAREPMTAPFDHMGFQCDTREEVDAIADEARREGTLVHPPKDSGGVIGYWTQIRDPDGHLVEFTHGQPLAGI
jgi:catechol 2,3-dioxygenase-like lactoylglutathione lyase family enzyme